MNRAVRKFLRWQTRIMQIAITSAAIGLLPTLMVLITPNSITNKALAVNVSVDRLELVPPAGSANTIDIHLSGNFLVGSDTEQAKLSGWSDVDLDLDLSSGDPVLNGFAFRSGDISLSDVTFSLAFGAIQLGTQGLSGVPSTPSPPGPVVDGQISAEHHLFTINRGSIAAANETTDFSAAPIIATGVGIGFASLTEVMPPTRDTRQFRVRLDIPVSADEVLTVENVPLLGTTDINADVQGQIVAEKVFELAIPDGDFNLDGIANCDDLQLIYDRAAASSTHATFDVDGDGQVTVADATAWVSERGFSIGDVNLSGVVDASDLEILITHRFTSDAGWCSGDLTGDGTVDGSDFNHWLAQQPPRAAVSVPEPVGFVYLFPTLLVALSILRRR